MIKKIQRRRKKHQHSKALFMGLSLVSLVLVLVAIGFNEIYYPKPAKDWFEVKSKAGDTIQFPKDDAPHQSKMEWWYYNGRLTSKSGKHYSFHYANFVMIGLMNHVVSHVSLTDLQNGQHYTDQRRTAGTVMSTKAGSKSFDFVVGDWLMAGSNGQDQLKVVAKQFSFDLNLQTELAPVIHGNKGLLNFGKAGSSYYYSRTRMVVSGTVNIGNNTETVDGLVWFDHQWGDFQTTQLSWDWFSLQLNDGSDLMIYNIKDKSKQPVLVTGSLSNNGHTEILTDTSFKITPGKNWVSDKTGISYPIEWQINIPKKNIHITTRGVVVHTEFDAKLTTYNSYWEGAVDVGGTHPGQGFMELTGYTH